ncbi:MAG: RseA family anti-sigma factor [Methylotenera sp.]
MNERLKESLSALIDGEVSELELQRILTHESRQEITACWQQFHQVSEWLKKDQSLHLDLDIRSKVMAAIRQEEPPHKA